MPDQNLNIGIKVTSDTAGAKQATAAIDGVFVIFCVGFFNLNTEHDGRFNFASMDATLTTLRIELCCCLSGGGAGARAALSGDLSLGCVYCEGARRKSHENVSPRS